MVQNNTSNTTNPNNLGNTNPSSGHPASGGTSPTGNYEGGGVQSTNDFHGGIPAFLDEIPQITDSLENCLGSTNTNIGSFVFNQTENATQLNTYLQNNNCSPEAQNFAIQAIDFLITNGGEFYFDNTLTNTLEFNNFNEFQNFYIEIQNNSNSTNFYLSSNQEAQNIRRDISKIHFSNFPQTDILVETLIEVPNVTNGLTEPNITFMDASLEGNTSLFTWEQVNETNTNEINGPLVQVVDYGGVYSVLEVTVKCKLVVGVKIGDYTFGATSYYIVKSSYNPTTGAFLESTFLPL